MTPPVLHLKQVSRGFTRRSLAVAEVSFCLTQGEILGLLGPSGCGKTTLLRLVAGFEQPQAGEIWLGSQSIATARHSLPPERRSIGMVFQDFALFPHLTVADNIAFGLTETRASFQSTVRSALALIHLESKANCYPHELSGGQQQRVALARALAPRPKLLLLDEPLSNLDVQVRLHLRQELRDILKTAHIAAIFVTHDQEEALALCDRVAVMHQGRLEQIGTPEQIYREPASRFVAEFVTQANFLSARRHGQQWQTEIGVINCETPTEAIEADLMIPQDSVQLQANADGTVTVRDRQFLGREYRYCLRTASGRDLFARSSVSLPVGTRVRLAVESQRVRAFPVQPVLPG